LGERELSLSRRAFGVIALLTCLLTVAFIFQDRLPAGFRQKAGEYMQKAQASLPEDLKQQTGQYSLDRIPTGHNFLAGVAIFTGVPGLIFLLQGIWTRSSATSGLLVGMRLRSEKA
jgi:hypothetical protein